MRPDATVRSATRGLATVAMLKANFDHGRDHLGMFEPFVRDGVVHVPGGDFSGEDVRDTVASLHQLTLPLAAVRTLLGRICGEGVLQRQGGRYFRTDKAMPTTDLAKERQDAEARQARLAEGLRTAAAEHGIEISTDEDALALIMKFLERHHIALAADDSSSVQESDDEDEETTPEQIATAAFLRDVVVAGGESADVLQEMLEGFVLQNTLLLKDISLAGRRFRDLHVFGDSVLLFGALGLRGPSTQTAVCELLSLLRETGAVLDVFQPTIGEMRGVLRAYEERLGTSTGRAQLIRSDLTHYFLAKRATPADVRQESAQVESNLRSLGFNIRDTPERKPESTLDEGALGRLLSKPGDDENEPRVVHDVDCVAGVLTYRRSHTSDSLDEAKAVFATTSSLTVKHTIQWYRDQGGRGFPPIIHYIALSNYAWLKKPASASRLKLHELVALCTAALRPSRGAWKRFVEHLRKLEESGDLSSDEVTAIVASDLTDVALTEADIDDDSDASSITEVIDRVKAGYKETADAEIEAARQTAERSQAAARRLHRHVEARARRIASGLTCAVATLVGASFVLGTLLSIVNVATGDPPPAVALALAVVPLLIAGVCGILWGWNLFASREVAEDRIARRVEHWLAGGNT
jgi:hypothetical protein